MTSCDDHPDLQRDLHCIAMCVNVYNVHTNMLWVFTTYTQSPKQLGQSVLWDCTSTSSLEGRGQQLNWENGEQSTVGSASYRHSSHWRRLPLGHKWGHHKSLDCLASPTHRRAHFLRQTVVCPQHSWHLRLLPEGRPNTITTRHFMIWEEKRGKQETSSPLSLICQRWSSYCFRTPGGC